MESPLRLILVSLLMFSLAGSGAAAEKPAAKEPSAAPAKKPGTPTAKKVKKPAPRKFTGDIVTVDTKTGVVSVKSATEEKQFMTQDAAKDALERVSVGDRVRVLYSEKDGKAVATSVRRLKLPQSKTKTSAPSAEAKTADRQKETKEKIKPRT